MVQSVKDHVNAIDRVESHYTRKDTKKLHLNNITKYCAEVPFIWEMVWMVSRQIYEQGE